MFRRLLRWLGWTAAALVVLALLAAAGIYVGSERVLRRTYDVALSDIAVPDSPLTTAEGERLARLRGCFGGCHGSRFEGHLFFDQPNVARLVAPSLTKAAARWTNAELARIVRHGVRPNGRSVFGMPSRIFNGLSDSDLGAILAFLRRSPDEGGLDPRLDALALGRVGLLTGQFRPEAAIINHAARPPATTPQDPLAHGDYLAHTICTQCHGMDLRGQPDIKSPDLRIVAAYTLEAFTRLLREGVPLDGRNLGLMATTARGRLKLLTDAEIAALHQYLRQAAERSGDAS
jgi:mono/diheme cytochrome c family protein